MVLAPCNYSSNKEIYNAPVTQYTPYFNNNDINYSNHYFCCENPYEISLQNPLKRNNAFHTNQNFIT